nr:DUF1592 domain-containing protein [Nannocystis sp. RBIL2]
MDRRIAPGGPLGHGARVRRDRVARGLVAAAIVAGGCSDPAGTDSASEATVETASEAGGTTLPTTGATEGEAPTGTGTTGEPLGPCEQAHPGEQVFRRLSHSEFNATVIDLFGAEVVKSPAARLAYEGDSNGFTNDVALLTVSWQHVYTYLGAAEAIAADVVAVLPQLLPCAGDPAADRGCAGEFVDAYAGRAYRRPLADGEREGLLASYDDAIAEGEGFAEGVELVVTRMLQSPQFLYRVELGAGPHDGAADRLTPYETAARLSYLLWGSMPDAELFAAAEQGSLATPEELVAQAERMLQHPHARRRVRQLHREWLHLGTVRGVQRDGGLFPGFDGLKDMLVAQAERFAEHVLFDAEAADLRTLLTAPYALLNADLAPLYGVDAAAAGLSAEDGDPQTDEFEVTPLDPTQRAGMFTHAAILGALAKPNAPAPVLRGKFVIERLLCGQTPPPPPDIVMQPPAVELGDTTRARWEALTEADGTTCAGCHASINPPGHAFGHYSAIGGWMADEGGAAIDASGSLAGQGIEGEFADAVEMMHLLADAPAVRACVLKQYFRHAYGRSVGAGQDACTMDELAARFDGSDGDLRDLLIALTQTDAFRFRPRAGGN